MYAPHTVTLYHSTEDSLTLDTTVNITILHGVLLDATKAANVRESGLVNADSVALYIPFSVKATDGLTLMEKRFVGPKEYRDSMDKTGLWTLDTENCFFVKGEVVEQGREFQYINHNYDDVYRVTSVDTKDFGTPDMRHWEVGGA